MLVTVIKAFPCADEKGLKSEMVLPGEREVRDALVPGLIADGFIDPAGHEPVSLSARRRTEIIERLIAAGRAQMEAAPDEHLIVAAAHLDRQAAEARETKIEPPLETGPAEPLDEMVDIPVEIEALPGSFLDWSTDDLATFNAWFDGLPEGPLPVYRITNEAVGFAFAGRRDGTLSPAAPPEAPEKAAKGKGKTA